MRKKKVIYLIIIILILIFIILTIYKSKKNTFDDITIFNLWSDMRDNEYVINQNGNQDIQINIYKTAQNTIGEKKKIAPGSFGKFNIKLKNINIKDFKIQLEDITKKPKNLSYEFNGKRYNSIKKLEDAINNVINSQNTICLKWNWQYENINGDLEDTVDGENAHEYILAVRILD